MRRSQHHNYTRQQIYDRDQGVCWICLRPVQQELKPPHPLSMTLDHIVPLVRGGRDTANNVALCHKRCNEAKSGEMPCQFTTKIPGLLYRHEGKSALLILVDSDAELYAMLNKIGRTRNKRLKKLVQNIQDELNLD